MNIRSLAVLAYMVIFALMLSGCNEDNTNIPTATNTVTAPAAPDNLISSIPQYLSVELRWRENSANEDGFIIERSVNSSSNWTSYAAVQTNSTSFLDTGLAAENTYYYRVYAYNSAGNSDPSNITSEAMVLLDPNVLEFNDLVVNQNSGLITSNSIDLLSGMVVGSKSSQKDIVLRKITGTANDFYFQTGDSSSTGYAADFGEFIEWTGIAPSEWDTLSRIWNSASSPDTLYPYNFTKANTQYPGNEFFGDPLNNNSVYAFFLKGKYQNGITPDPVYGMIRLDSAWSAGSPVSFYLQVDVKINIAGRNRFRRSTPNHP